MQNSVNALALRSRSIILAVLISASASQSFAGPLEEDNKKVVVDFYTMAFKDHMPKQAADTYIGDVYIQHNPRVPNGTEAFYGFFEGYFRENPTASNEIKRVVAEGDLVVLHSHSRISPEAPGNAIVDIFRVENGKIVEHWDVMQAVPAEPSPNGNTMFDGSSSE